MKYKNLAILILILILATILRVYGLDKVPVALFGDEVDVGYQAYSLLKTGQDLQGNSWPILIHSLSEYRAPLFIYSAIPSVAVFGLNEWGVRVPAALWGILGIFGLYLLANKLFGIRVALIAALLLSLSPWHIQYSRAAFEVTMLLTFLIFGAYFFLQGLDKKVYLFLSAIFFGLTPYIYSTSVVFMPLFVLLMTTVYREKLKKYKLTLIWLLALFTIILSPYIFQTFTGNAGNRFSIISIFTDQVLKDKVTLAQKAGFELGHPFEKIFHNKPLIWSQVFILNYMRSFSPEFLFTMGDPNFRHSIHEMGEMYYFESLLLLIGLVLLVIKQNIQPTRLFLLGWLLIAPIPAALTADGGFHATRTFILLPPLVILVSLGINTILDNLKTSYIKYLATILGIIAIFNVAFFWHRYFLHYPVESWRAWHFGFKETFSYLKDHELSYERILINNTYEPTLIRFLFWTKFNPIKFHQSFVTDKQSKNITDGFDGFAFADKYYFGSVNKPFEDFISSKDLYIASAQDDITNPLILENSNVKVLKIISSPTHQPIFYIISGIKP